MPDPGWLKRQIAKTKEEMSQLPAWMKGEVRSRTMKDAWAERGKVSLNGHTWDAYSLNVRGDQVVLLRTIRVKPHFKRGRYAGGGMRYVEIRRPITDPAPLPKAEGQEARP
jgi:hypothetical protein